MGYAAARRRVNEVLREGAPGDTLSRVVNLSLAALIVLNVAAIIFESVASVRDAAASWFLAFETFSVAVFTAEYVLRLWSCVEAEGFAGHRGRLRFALKPMPLIDLAAVLPFYLTFATVDLRFLRVLRLLRILRVAKLARYSTAMQTLGRVLVKKREELSVTVLALLVLLIVASVLMYHAERDAQPEAFASIPAAMWWAAATLTTVGYGDVYPVTALGRLLGAVIAILGIGMFALPAGILGGAFMEEVSARRRGPPTCPHCGREIGRT
jgi:voltage-gated potassium channel